MNFRPPQALVSIDVAHAAQNALVQQQGLDAGPSPANAPRKLLLPDFERLRTKSSELVIQFLARQVGHPAKSPRIRIAQLPAIIQRETHMRMFVARLSGRLGSHVSRHSKVNEQRRSTAFAILWWSRQ